MAALSYGGDDAALAFVFFVADEGCAHQEGLILWPGRLAFARTVDF